MELRTSPIRTAFLWQLECWTTMLRVSLSRRMQPEGQPMKMEVGCRWRKKTGAALGLMDMCTVSGAETNRMVPSESPMSQPPSRKLLVAVTNSSLWEVKIFSSEWELILLALSSLCLTPLRQVKMVLMSSLSWKKKVLLMVSPSLYIFYSDTFFYCSFNLYSFKFQINSLPKLTYCPISSLYSSRSSVRQISLGTHTPQKYLMKSLKSMNLVTKLPSASRLRRYLASLSRWIQRQGTGERQVLRMSPLEQFHILSTCLVKCTTNFLVLLVKKPSILGASSISMFLSRILSLMFQISNFSVVCAMSRWVESDISSMLKLTISALVLIWKSCLAVSIR